MSSLTVAQSAVIDKQYLLGIYEQHNLGLYRYAYRLLGDQNLAEECVSETFSRFLKVVRSRGVLQDNVQAYLYRVAHNWITDTYRRRKPTAPLEMEIPEEAQREPDQIFMRKIEQERVRNALMQLPYDQRQVIVLRMLEDWSHEEVARELGKTVEASRALQYRALSALRRMLLDREESQT